jgi:hypothetical protein
MPVRPLIVTYLLIPCAVTTGCGTSAEPKADKGRLATLDLGEEKEMRAKAKGLNGKIVLVKGSAILRGIKSNRWARNHESVLDLEPKVAVKSLVAAPKE